MKDSYYIGSGDYFGQNGPNEKFNKVIKPKDMDKVASMFEEIYSIGYSNGMDNAQVDD